MKLNDYHIKQIEKALGFELYDYQKNILKGVDNYIPSGRRTGRTLTMMLVELTKPSKLREPIELKVMNRGTCYYGRELTKLRENLVERGIPCREIKIIR